MIESRDILALCDRFEQYLIPLDLHVLQRRYNGQTFLSTYAVGREMGSLTKLSAPSRIAPSTRSRIV